MSKRPNRSDKYQHTLLELAVGCQMLENFSNDDSISYRLNPFQYNEDLLDLEDELKIEFWRIVDTLLTKRQKEVIQLSALGLTQTEIAKKLNVNQSSITKSIHGNTDYKGKKKVYGGSKRKILKIIENDDKIRSILKRMQELREKKW